MKKSNKNRNTFPSISNALMQNMRLKEYFLNISLKEFMDEPSVDEIKQTIKDKRFYCIHGKHCMYCASKDICLEYGANNGGE